MIHEVKKKKEEQSKRNLESKGNVHVVVVSKGFVAIWTLARSRSEAFFDAFLAKDMAACLDCSVLEVPAAHCAKCKSL